MTYVTNNFSSDVTQYRETPDSWGQYLWKVYGTEVRPNSYSKVHLQDFTRHDGYSEILKYAVTTLNLSLKSMVTIRELSSVTNKFYMQHRTSVCLFASFQHIFQLL